jgi:alkylated DNA repair dioxygenase AlkB
MNTTRYPWLDDLESPEAAEAIRSARKIYTSDGAVIFHDFITDEALRESTAVSNANDAAAFTTDDVHTPYLKDISSDYPVNSIYNHQMQTRVASIAYDELPKESSLPKLYRDPRLLQLVKRVVGVEELYLSNDPLGCCSINVFRPGDFHSFHFDESEFSTTLMLQEDADGGGLFQYTPPVKFSSSDLALAEVASAIEAYDERLKDVDSSTTHFAESASANVAPSPPPPLQTLNFTPGTLSIFSGSKSLHRVTTVRGSNSRLVAVFTYSNVPNFCNSSRVQKLFWGRSAAPQTNLHT